MKKLFLLLGVCGLFAACTTKNDCDCTATDMGAVSPVSASTPSISEYEGECEDVKWDDLSSAIQADWTLNGSITATLKCVEH
ncbi:MAG: hypothetical protein LBO06_04240 [Bacteroidales bacterium]|jgi:hypothetical protein|nr:hypothetical protein [Bacteroidales bacterium]